MRKLVLVIIAAAAFMYLPLSAQAQTSEAINYFGTAIQARKDGSILVVERIKYDFSDVQRHGIIRKIPYIIKNDNNDKYKMGISVESVTDEQGKAYSFSTSKEDDYIQIKIGDADKTITGEHYYAIAYTVKGALRYFSDHSELYWNITGDEWTVPIKEADAYIEFPSTIPEDQFKGICYTGYHGSTDQKCRVSVSGNKAYIKSETPLDPGQGLTFSVSIPKGIVAVLEPEKIVDFWTTTVGKIVSSILTLLVVALAFSWYMLYPLWLPIKWFLYGRDPNVGKPVSAWFDPPKNKNGRFLTAGETGTILDEKVDMRDISAMIIQLAQKGYLEIIEKKENDFHLLKKKEFDSKLEPFEKTLLNGIFKSGDTLQLKDARLETTITKASDELYDSLTKSGYFPENPKTSRTFYAVIMGLAGVTFNLPLLITGTLFGLNMARKTIEGAQAANVAKGMKHFLSSQERQLNFQGEKQLFFEKLLPFAIAFGVEENWINRFKDINISEPDWYHGYYSGGFQPTHFAHSLHSSVNSISTAATPVVSSTGSSSGFSGGSSGGGGGGGGGGSW